MAAPTAGTSAAHTGEVPAGLDEKLASVRRPGLQSQQQAFLILTAVEETLKDQASEFTPTAYFAALLSLLSQYVSAGADAKQEVATAVVYLLDTVTPHVPKSILRSKFSSILTVLEPAISKSEVDAPFLRSAIGSLSSLLIVQDGQAWALPQSQTSPRRATGLLLALALDGRPKVRKRAQDGLYRVLTHKPPSPSLDHPAADTCAETALRNFESLAGSAPGKKQRASEGPSSQPALIHAMQLIKTIASACGGWPSRSLESLCEVLFSVARSRSEFLTTAAFEVFEAIFAGMAKQQAFERLPRLLEAINELQPSQNDSQLLPPWLAVLSRGYDVASQFEPDESFHKLPDLFERITTFLASSSYNIRSSASECLISLLVNCIPASVIIEPSIYDEKTLERLSKTINDLLSVKYQASWMEVFNVLGAAFDNFKGRATGLLSRTVATVGELRAQNTFSGKERADEVLGKAIAAMGPEAVLEILPLNLASPRSGQQGRAWLVPIMRDAVANTNLSHFKNELVPLSEILYQRMSSLGGEKTMEGKVMETLLSQVWSTLPGYCDRTVDVKQAFGQPFAELLSNVLYKQPELRLVVCRSLQNLVDSQKLIRDIKGEEDLILQGRIGRQQAQANLDHIATFAPNLLAVLFNVYGETTTQQRGPVLECIDAYLSITSATELSNTFERVKEMLEQNINDGSDEPKKQKSTPKASDKPPVSYALMDIIVTAAVYLPRQSFQALFNIAATVIAQRREPQLQKKAYKLLPRLAQSETGQAALKERNVEIRQMLLDSAQTVTVPARKDRLHALEQVVASLPSEDLSFVPSILPEVILATKENAERARTAAFDLLVLIGDKMHAGGTLQGPSGTVTANLDEYLTMLSAGLAGTSPHMISASVTALSRVLFTFHASISQSSLLDLLQTIDLFLKSPSREIVRSVLGFVKVCIIALPTSTMAPRLPNLIPALMSWSHEQKAHFRVKVKSILDRMMRRFGVETVEKYCPPEDRKLIANIRKRRERSKKKRTAGPADAEEAFEAEEKQQRYESGFDEAIYGSDEEDSEAGGSDVDAEMEDRPQRGHSQRQSQAQLQKGGKQRKNETYIHEDEDEPLDLLDRRSLGNISTTKPLRTHQKPPQKRNAKTDADGKLVLREEDEDSDDEMPDFGDGDAGLEKGINAYVDAIKGRDAAKRGQKGKLKFTNKRDTDAMEEDDDGVEAVGTRPGRQERSSRAGRGQIRGGRGFTTQRRGLSAGSGRGGRVVKSPQRGGRGGGARGRRKF